MRRLLLVISLALVIVPSVNGQLLRRRAILHPSSCVRHEPVGFGSIPEILGELGQVYANCYLHPACVGPANQQTIQIDGYVDYSKWVWTGPSSNTFSILQQNSMIDRAINLASAVATSGQVIVGMTFFNDIIVGNGPVIYVIGVKVTFATCSQVSVAKGTTWIHTASNAGTGTITVGCNGCNPYSGDTVCTQQLPLLCIYKPTPAFPVPVGVNNADLYNQWSGGVVATTQAVAGNSFATAAAANLYCQSQFGPGWRVAEFHDGWGWNFQAYGGTVNAPAVPSARFWVHINDQPTGNCWTP